MSGEFICPAALVTALGVVVYVGYRLDQKKDEECRTYLQAQFRKGRENIEGSKKLTREYLNFLDQQAKQKGGYILGAARRGKGRK